MESHQGYAWLRIHSSVAPRSPPLELVASHPIGNARVLFSRFFTAAGSMENVPDTVCSICGPSNQRLNAPSKMGRSTPEEFGRVCTWAKLEREQRNLQHPPSVLPQLSALAAAHATMPRIPIGGPHPMKLHMSCPLRMSIGNRRCIIPIRDRHLSRVPGFLQLRRGPSGGSVRHHPFRCAY